MAKYHVILFGVSGQLIKDWYTTDDVNRNIASATCVFTDRATKKTVMIMAENGIIVIEEVVA